MLVEIVKGDGVEGSAGYEMGKGFLNTGLKDTFCSVAKDMN